MEIREFRAEGVETDDKGKLTGLVTPFDREAVIGDLKRGGWREKVKPGFFTKTLREADYLLVYQHDLAKPMARKSAGNLTFTEGEHKGQRGLVMDSDPVDTSYTRDCMNLVRAKVINGMSFGFNVVKDAWFDDDGNPSDRMNGTRRELLEGQLIEGSPVTRPAYGGTAISARDEANALIEARQRAAGQDANADEERAPKPYGDVPYADPKNGKYPIDKDHVKAAWAYINQRKNAAKYPLNGVTLKSVKDRIRKAMVKFGFTSGTAAEAKFEFASPEWRDDDPYMDDFYEIDDVEDTSADEEAKSEEPHANLVAALLARRDEPAVREAIDYCISLRDDPDGKEYAAIDTALQHLRKSPPDVGSALGVLRKHQGKRDDPDGQEYAAIDRACRMLEEEPPDVKGAKNVLASNQMWRRDQDGEPDTSTPEDEDDDALLVATAQATYSRGVGLI